MIFMAFKALDVWSSELDPEVTSFPFTFTQVLLVAADLTGKRCHSTDHAQGKDQKLASRLTDHRRERGWSVSWSTGEDYVWDLRIVMS